MALLTLSISNLPGAGLNKKEFNWLTELKVQSGAGGTSHNGTPALAVFLGYFPGLIFFHEETLPSMWLPSWLQISCHQPATRTTYVLNHFQWKRVKVIFHRSLQKQGKPFLKPPSNPLLKSPWIEFIHSTILEVVNDEGVGSPKLSLTNLDPFLKLAWGFAIP